MIKQLFKDIYTPELAEGAIINDEFTGFKEDYLILHCLLRIYQPKSVFEIGTNLGRGTKIIKNALPDSDVYTLDLPTELAHISLQHPLNEGHGDKVGELCDLPFTQLRGDSMTFDFSKYPCEGYWIDAEHCYKNVNHETMQAINCGARFISFHDSDIEDVYAGIVDAFNQWGKNYTLYRVTDTRILYAIRNI